MTKTSHRAPSAPRNDRGSILPLAMIVTVMMSMIVISLARYTSTDIQYGRIVEDRADRLSEAEAGLRHKLEQEQEGGPFCATAVGTGAGVTQTLPVTISGATVDVHCVQVDGTLSNITAWATVITGNGGVPDDQGLITNSGNGAIKVFGGPSFIADPDLLGVNAPLEMRDGNLWYTDLSCDDGGQYAAGSHAGDALTFNPTSRGLWCTNKAWSDLFTEPPIPPTLSSLPVNPASQPLGGCTVWEPGRYTVAPVWGTNNYMKSGNYVFDNVGTMQIKQTTITAGREGVAGGQQEVDNGTCDTQRDGDVPQGATFYMDGNSNFEIISQGSLEILRRQQGNDLVSVHALSTHTLAWNDAPILSTATGNNKQMAIQGMVWAPNARLVFGNVANSAAAQLSGGVVLAALQADAAASVTGFVIQVAGGPQQDRIAYTATATKNGTTQVRVVSEVRFSPPPTGSGVGTWEFAMNSWRVCDGACS